jgi:hypothetical protein
MAHCLFLRTLFLLSGKFDIMKKENPVLEEDIDYDKCSKMGLLIGAHPD